MGRINTTSTQDAAIQRRLDRVNAKRSEDGLAPFSSVTAFVLDLAGVDAAKLIEERVQHVANAYRVTTDATRDAVDALLGLV